MSADKAPAASAWEREGFGYTLASGRLFADFAKFHEWCEALMHRPILTHEFADEALWADMKARFEALFTEGLVSGV